MFYKSKFEKKIKNFNFREDSKDLVFALKRNYEYIFCNDIDIVKAYDNDKESFFLMSHFKNKDFLILVNSGGSYTSKKLERYSEYDAVSYDEYKNSKEVLSACEKLKGCGFAELGFCNTIFDKLGNEYTVEHYKEADITLSNTPLVGDLTYIKKDKNVVGYILTKYFNENSVIKNFNINSSAISFLKKEYSMFDNIAVVDYSNIKEDFRGLGIGKEAYKLIIDNFLNRGIYFRESTVQSDGARALWSSIKEDYKGQIKNIKINNNNFVIIGKENKKGYKIGGP